MKKYIYILIASMIINVSYPFTANAFFIVIDPTRMTTETNIKVGIDEINEQLLTNISMAMMILLTIGPYGEKGQKEMYENQAEKMNKELELTEYIEMAMEGEVPGGMLDGIMNSVEGVEEEITQSIASSDRRVALQMAQQSRDKFVDSKMEELFITKDSYTLEDEDEIKTKRYNAARNAAVMAYVLSDQIRRNATASLEGLAEEENVMVDLRTKVIRGAEIETIGTMYAIHNSMLSSLGTSFILYDGLLSAPVVMKK